MQKFQCPSGDTWDRFILDPDFPLRSKLEKHLEICPYCRFLVAEREAELRELNKIRTGLVSTNVIYLSALDYSQFADSPEKTLMAAEGKNNALRQHAVTMASSDQKVLLRVVRDANTDETWLYVLSDNPEIRRNVLIRLFDLSEDFITDNDGRVNLGIIDWPERKSLKAEIHLPKAVFSLSPVTRLEKGEGSVDIDSSGGDRIRVTFSKDSHGRRVEVQILEIRDLHEGIPLKVAVKSVETTRLTRIEYPGMTGAAFDKIDSVGDLEIYLYQ
jgi:hypothetical protein